MRWLLKGAFTACQSIKRGRIHALPAITKMQHFVGESWVHPDVLCGFSALWRITNAYNEPRHGPNNTQMTEREGESPLRENGLCCSICAGRQVSLCSISLDALIVKLDWSSLAEPSQPFYLSHIQHNEGQVQAHFGAVSHWTTQILQQLCNLQQW